MTIAKVDIEETVVGLILNGIIALQRYAQLVLNARKEGRKLTLTELDNLAKIDDTSSVEFQKLIDQAKAEGR